IHHLGLLLAPQLAAQPLAEEAVVAEAAEGEAALMLPVTPADRQCQNLVRFRCRWHMVRFPNPARRSCRRLHTRIYYCWSLRMGQGRLQSGRILQVTSLRRYPAFATGKDQRSLGSLRQMAHSCP